MRGTGTGRRGRALAPVAWLLLAAALSTSCARIVQLDLPELDAVPRTPPEQSMMYDADGNQLAVLRTEFRERVSYDQIPRTLIDAVVTAEDRRFWIHAGVDARAIARAALTNAAAGQVEEGGSTLTQQLVKNLYMSDAERTPSTKLREALLARQVEEELGKEEILEEYLNTVYFGNGAYGVEAAAQTYWRKDAADLTLEESALLAGIIRSPESLNPERDPEPARDRRDDVLRAMAELGLVTREATDAAIATPLAVQPRPRTPETREPYWVDFVIRTLLEDPSFGGTEAERAARLFGGGLRIHTTLQPRLQEAARATVAARLPDAADPDAAVVTVDPATGKVLAAFGSGDYDTDQFDLATQARRQPGSTFKTFVLAAAVTSGMGPESLVNGNQGVLSTRNGPWTVRNYGRNSYGQITLAEATRASVNSVFARLIVELGVGRVAALARAMGVASPINEDAPIALGGLTNCCTPLDMASSYATLSALGLHIPATAIDRIETADGAVVWRPDERPQRVLEPSASFVTTQMLREVVEETNGTGTAATIPGWEVAGKTGTVSDYSDAWFVGYTATLSTSVWVGHREGRIPLRNVHGVRQVTGGSIPAGIWRDYMVMALADQQPQSFVLPQEYYEVLEIDPETGLLAAPWCPGETEPVPRVIAPRETCPSPPPPPPPPPAPATPPAEPVVPTQPTDPATETTSPSPATEPVAPPASPPPPSSPPSSPSPPPSPKPPPPPPPSPTPVPPPSPPPPSPSSAPASFGTPPPTAPSPTPAG